MKLKLDDLRIENIGEIYAWFPARGNLETDMVLITFPEYTKRAFYYSCQSLEQLEKSSTIINQGNCNLDAISLWFMAIESYINTILKITCRILGKNFSDYVKQDIGTRLTKFCEMLLLDKIGFYKTGIMQKFDEFKTFRNEIFHDRFDNSKLTFVKTQFSTVPYLCNQVDVMQSSIIALELFGAFRNSIPGLDLMPAICVQKNGSFGFVKYDILYKYVVRPLFEESLKKHNLNTGLITEPLGFTFNDSSVLAEGQVKIIIKALTKLEPQRPNKVSTSIAEDLMKKVRSIIKIDTEKDFQLPDYTRTSQIKNT